LTENIPLPFSLSGKNPAGSIMKPNVLHVFKETYTLPEYLYLGATKDIRGRTEYFQARGIDFKELLAYKDRYYEAISSLSRETLQQYSAVIFEATFSPSAIQLVKTISPATTVIVRSHNAELLHRWDYVRSQGLSLSAFKSLRQLFKNAACDYLSGKHADFISSISRWENDHYWSRAVNNSKLKHVPFFLPESYSAMMPKSDQKRLQCVNFTSASPNPLIADATRNFINAVKNLKGQCSDWTFYITGDETKYGINTPDEIKWLGFLKDPYQILAESRAMALLSDYGYGFKTKILEAIVAKAYILLTKGLYQRMPDEVRPYCIPIDIHSPDSFKNALEQSAKPYPDGDPNAEFRRQAFAVLDEMLLIKKLKE